MQTRVVFMPGAETLGPQEVEVEQGIMGNYRQIAQKILQLLERGQVIRSTRQHFAGNAGQFRRFGVQLYAWVYKALPGSRDSEATGPVFCRRQSARFNRRKMDSSNFNQPFAVAIQTSRFYVQRHKPVAKINAGTVIGDGGPVINQVTFHTVNDLNRFTVTCRFQRCFTGIWERLHDTVIGYGYGFVAKVCCRTDDLGSVANSIAGTHFGVAMQLNSFSDRIIAAAAWLLGCRNSKNLRLQLTAIAGIELDFGMNIYRFALKFVV